jgi:hypothetical protein
LTCRQDSAHRFAHFRNNRENYREFAKEIAKVADFPPIPQFPRKEQPNNRE